jgi:hypothetical protein
MTGSKIMVIRHAEKPDEAGTTFGVSVEGNQDPEALIVRGWQRAGALTTFFAPPDGTSEISASRRPAQFSPLTLPITVRAYGHKTLWGRWPN